MPNIGYAQLSGIPSLRHQTFDETVVTENEGVTVAQRIIVQGRVSRQGLTDLLKKLHIEIKNREGHLTGQLLHHLTIWAYISKIHAQSKELWLAKVETKGNTPLEIRFNDQQILAIREKADTRFGKDENLRKKIWQELYATSDQAKTIAENQLPWNPQKFNHEGQTFMLTKNTILVLADAEVNDPPANIRGAKNLEAQTKITLLQSITLDGRLWHYVEVRSPLFQEDQTPQLGWVDSLMLRQQNKPTIEYYQKLQPLINENKFSLELKLIEKHTLSFQQLDDIHFEAILKNWPISS